MASDPKLDQESTPIPSPTDAECGTLVSAVAASKDVSQDGKPWLLQDWIALTVAISLSGLFIGSAWTTCRDWPVVMRQIAAGKAKLQAAEKVVRDPTALKRGLEAAIEKAEAEIADLQKKKSRLEMERVENEVRKQALDKEISNQSELTRIKEGALDMALSQAKSRVISLNEKVDFTKFMAEGPGQEPDPWGPNDWRMEWRAWKVKKDVFDQSTNAIHKANDDLLATRKQLVKFTDDFKLAKFACEKVQDSILNAESDLNQKFQDKNTAERMLSTSLVELDHDAVIQINYIRRTLRGSETTKAALLLQNIPTIVALFVVSISALTRLALLRGCFNSRALIHP